MPYEPNDADTVLADFGVPVSWTGAPAGVLGLFNKTLDVAQLGPVAGGEVLARHSADEAVLAVKPGILDGLEEDIRIVVDGKPFKLREPVADGRESIFDRRYIAPADA